VGSAPVLNAACDLGGEVGIGQELLDECGKDLLSGDAGDSEAVGGFSLPDVERPVYGGWEVDGPSCSLAACSLDDLLSDDDPFGPSRRIAGRGWCAACGAGAK
jgi:hypothetical protein